MVESAMSESTDDVIPTAASNNIGARGAEVVLIQRYLNVERSVIAAICNAAQEPGETF